MTTKRVKLSRSATVLALVSALCGLPVIAMTLTEPSTAPGRVLSDTEANGLRGGVTADCRKRSKARCAARGGCPAGDYMKVDGDSATWYIPTTDDKISCGLVSSCADLYSWGDKDTCAGK